VQSRQAQKTPPVFGFLSMDEPKTGAQKKSKFIPAFAVWQLLLLGLFGHTLFFTPEFPCPRANRLKIQTHPTL
jgi:hypothetical protein